jgi:hypothetical protein
MVLPGLCIMQRDAGGLFAEVRFMRGLFVLLAALCLAAPAAGDSGSCRYEMTGKRRVTYAPGNSHTCRSNATCITTDKAGVTHLVYEDKRSGEFEIYYVYVRNDTLSPEIRITQTPGESSFPCIASGGGSVYILWQEMVGKDFEIEYARLVDGQVVARKRLTDTRTESACPVAAYDGDGTLHVAWHEGPYHQTGIIYGKVVADSLVHVEEIPVETSGAFRPDIACDGHGRVLLTWFEGFEVKSKYWDGAAWQPTLTVAVGKQKAWRMSVAFIAPGRWGLAWFDRTEDAEYPVYAAFFDGAAWQGEVRLNSDKIGYYPNVCAGPGGIFLVAWEGKDMSSGDYSLELRCHDGHQWHPVQLLQQGRSMTRYPSLSLDPDGNFQTIWFSDGRGTYEVYYGVLRRE